MIEWKIGKNHCMGFLVKIKCVENAKTLMKDPDEKMYQLVLLKKGNTILNVNGKSIAISEPSVLCLSDKDEVTFKKESGEYVMDIIYFHPSVINHLFDCDNLLVSDFITDWTSSINQDRFMLTPFFERIVPYGGCLSVELNTFHRILQLFDKLQKQLKTETDDFWPCRSRSYLIEILIIMQMRYIDHSAPKEFLELNESQKEMEDILDYIHSNYPNRITIELLTKEFGMNRNSLTKRFTELTGFTPISYLILHRLKVAESLLVNTEIPVHEICERVGFSELSNFMKSFKKKYGQTPSNYRALYTTME